jgi:hypothetical protein
MVSLIIALSTATVVRLLFYATSVFSFYFFIALQLRCTISWQSLEFAISGLEVRLTTYKDISRHITEPLP